jgi:cellobiose transport system substrate-binding protein
MRRAARARVGVLVGAALLALTACTSTVAGTATYAGPPPVPKPTVDPNRPVTIQYAINHEIDPETRRAAQVYHQLHPNVTVQLEATDFAAYWPRLEAQLAAGYASSDVYVVTADHLGTIRARHDLWADLGALGATGDDFVPAAWQPAVVGSQVLALPASMEPIGICYRPSLLARAGLPTGRDTLAAHWRTWQDYVEDGSVFGARVHDATWLDSSTSVFDAMVAGGPGYYDKDGKPAYDTEPTVRAAFETAVRGIQGTAMPRAPEFQGQWFGNLQAGRIATLPCFPGLLPLLRTASGGAKWDLAPAPTAGNIGTTYYAVPKNSRNAAAAYGFIDWMTSTTEQRRTFTISGPYPTRRSAATAPDVAGKTDRNVGNAPTGRIFGAVAGRLPTTWPGANPLGLQQAFAKALELLPPHSTLDDAWRSASLAAHATRGGN